MDINEVKADETEVKEQQDGFESLDGDFKELDQEMADEAVMESDSEREPNGKDHKKTALIILLILLVLGLGGVIAYLLTRPKPVQESAPTGNVMIDTRADSEKEEASNPLSDRMVHFSGIEDADVNADSVVYLENLPENEDFYMTYKIENADTGEVYEETGLIPSGEHVAWKVGEDITEPGEYHLNFHEAPYWIDPNGNQIALTSGNNQVTFTMH